jgi:hypothetical protein
MAAGLGSEDLPRQEEDEEESRPCVLRRKEQANLRLLQPQFTELEIAPPPLGRRRLGFGRAAPLGFGEEEAGTTILGLGGRGELGLDGGGGRRGFAAELDDGGSWAQCDSAEADAVGGGGGGEEEEEVLMMVSFLSHDLSLILAMAELEASLQLLLLQRKNIMKKKSSSSSSSSSSSAPLFCF